MSDEERAIMGRHAAHWKPYLRAFAAGDPAVTSGTAQIEIGKMLAGFVRPG